MDKLLLVVIVIAAVVVIFKVLKDKKEQDKKEFKQSAENTEIQPEEIKEPEKPIFKKTIAYPESEVTADGKIQSKVLKGGIVKSDDENLMFMDGIKALVVEDEASDRQRIVDMLSEMNIAADIAENGLKSIQLIRENKYDMVFISYEMSRMDGVQTLRNIRKTEDSKSKDATFYIMIPETSKEPEIFFSKEGFKAMLKKPVGKFALQNAAAEAATSYLVKNDAETLNYIKYFYETEKVLQEFGMCYEEALKNHSNDLKALQTEAADFCDSYEDMSEEIMDSLYGRIKEDYADKMRILRKSAENLGVHELYEMADEHVDFAVKDNMDMAEEGWRTIELKWEETVSGLRSWLGKTDKLLNATQVLAVQDDSEK